MNRGQKLEQQADRLTCEMPPGTEVKFWPGTRQGEGKTGNIKHRFTVLGYNVVGWIDTARGCIAASHIERA